MGLIECASERSRWRGADYHERKKVIMHETLGDGITVGKVSGSDGNVYDVKIDINHPRKSTCNCPFAKGRRVVCKHMIAVYFKAYPEKYQEYLQKVQELEEEAERIEQEYWDEEQARINSLSKEELREELMEALIEIDELKSRYW